MERISKSRFKPHALEIFRAIEASGRPIIITDNGEPRLEIRPCRHNGDQLEALRGSVLHFDSEGK